MSDKAVVECPTCHKRFSVLASNLGVRARCKGCGNSFRLEEVNDDLPDLGVISEPVMSEQYCAPTAPPPFPSTASAKQGSWIQLIKEHRVTQIVVIVVCLVVILGVGWLKYQRKAERRDRVANAIDETFIKPADPAPNQRITRPEPAPAPVKVVSPPPRMVVTPREGFVESTATVTQRHARRTTVRLLLPPGEHAPGSLPCVFVCPAGSNLLMGVAFSDDEHEDYLPLLRQGMAVCLYSLDGTVRDPENAPDMQLVAAMLAYRESAGGLKNLADAIDTVLASHPEIDAKRLATSGHSSAGTIAVVAAAKEPRIVAAAAFAPVLNLPSRFHDVIDQFDADMTRFVYASSPSQVDQFNGPVFIYHCRDDDNVPATEAEFIAKKHGNKVKVEIVASGGHTGALTKGAASGFAFLATTLNAKPIHVRPQTETANATAAPVRRAAATRPSPVASAPAAPATTQRAGMPRPASTQGRQPEYQKFTGFTMMLGSRQLSTHARTEGFVMGPLGSEMEILRPVESGVAPRLLVYAFRREPPQIKGSRNPRPNEQTGIIHVDVDQNLIYVHRQENTKDVPFLTADGKAMRTEGEDRHNGQTTREVLYASQIGEALVVMHLIAGLDDAEGMDALEKLVATFEVKDAPARRAP